MPKAGGGIPKGKGLAPKAGGGIEATPLKTAGETSKTSGETPKDGMGDMAGMSGMRRRGELFESDECAAEAQHVAKSTKGSAHEAYNEDGYYVTKAACWVVSQFKKAGAA
jgi:hypothetical protein